PSGFLRSRLQESGIFLYSEDAKVYTYANQAFLGVYNAAEKDAAVFVKTDGLYCDLISGETFRAENGKLKLPQRDICAYLLRLQ
ncbi:MAG: hypothetical protein IJX14_04120, partial [Clostridia bacterium]|nr:hypothetical protein [Clostridia bacterium]